jgi:hypothetical protein
VNDGKKKYIKNFSLDNKFDKMTEEVNNLYKNSK